MRSTIRHAQWRGRRAAKWIRSVESETNFFSDRFFTLYFKGNRGAAFKR